MRALDSAGYLERRRRYQGERHARDFLPHVDAYGLSLVGLAGAGVVRGSVSVHIGLRRNRVGWAVISCRDVVPPRAQTRESKFAQVVRGVRAAGRHSHAAPVCQAALQRHHQHVNLWIGKLVYDVSDDHASPRKTMVDPFEQLVFVKLHRGCLVAGPALAELKTDVAILGRTQVVATGRQPAELIPPIHIGCDDPALS